MTQRKAMLIPCSSEYIAYLLNLCAEFFYVLRNDKVAYEYVLLDSSIKHANINFVIGRKFATKPRKTYQSSFHPLSPRGHADAALFLPSLSADLSFWSRPCSSLTLPPAAVLIYIPLTLHQYGGADDAEFVFRLISPRVP